MAQSKQVWFGTEGAMQWIKAPATNMGRSRRNWESGTQFLNGGYSQISSDYSALSYSLAWNVVDSKTESIISGYANKAYGTGPIYFLDPFSYDSVMPLMWSAAHLTASDAPSLIRGYRPTKSRLTVNGAGFPTHAATYALSPGMPALETLVPVPRGYTLLYAAYGTATGTAGVRVDYNLNVPWYAIAPMLGTGDQTLGTGGYQAITNADGENDLVKFKLSGSGQLSLVGVHAQVVPMGQPGKIFDYYPLGKGNSGMRFEGTPQITSYSSLLDQQAMTATLVETGVWE